jgi:hypothetical protein
MSLAISPSFHLSPCLPLSASHSDESKSEGVVETSLTAPAAALVPASRSRKRKADGSSLPEKRRSVFGVARAFCMDAGG